MKKTLIIGASSGIGKALAIEYALNGYEVGLAARRTELLEELSKSIKTKTYIKQVDLSNTSSAMNNVQSLIDEMGNIDVFIINSGVCYNNLELDWSKDLKTIEVNVLGFAAMTNLALKHFMKNGQGHLVGISSVSAIRGEGSSSAYSASKAFMSNYLEGVRHRMAHENQNIHVTDVQPGWVETDMAKGKKTFWMVSAKQAAMNIFSAVDKKRTHVYITSRWRLYAWLVKLAPNWFYDRYF